MKSREDSIADHSNTKTTTLAVGGVVAIAVFGLLGYIPDWEMLGSLHSDFIPMAPSTAISFILLATILFVGKGAISRRYKPWCQSIVLAVTGFGLLKFAEYYFGVEVSFEETIISPTATLGEIPIGIMSPSTGAIFVLAGVAILLYSTRWINERDNTFLGNLSGGLGCAVIIGSFTFIMGYIYGNPVLYEAGRTVPMALTTAAAFLLLGAGLVHVNGKKYFPMALFSGSSTRAKMMRVFVPVIALSLLSIDILHRLLPRTLSHEADPILDAIMAVSFTVISILIVLRLSLILGNRLDKAEAKRKRAENALRESEEEFRSAFYDSIIGKVMIDRDGHFCRVNKAFCDLIGYDERELLTLGPREISVPGEMVPDSYPIKKLLSGEDSGLRVEKKYRHKNGQAIIGDITISPVRNNEGAVTHLMGHIVDITERIRVEKEIKKQQYYLSKAQEIGSIGTWELNLIENKLIWTDEEYRVFGIPLGTELNYESSLERVHPDDRDYVKREFKAALEGKPYDIEHRLVVEGKVKWVREKADIQFDTDGKAASAIGFTQDITERKAAEDALRASEAKLQSYIDNAPDGVIVTDRQGKFLEVNPAVCNLFGYTQEELLKLDMEDALTCDMQGDKEELFKRVLSEGHGNSEFSGQLRDGRQIHFSVDAVKVDEYRLLAFFKDITARKRDELKLQTFAHDLGERVKELRGLYGLWQLTGNPNLTPEEVYQQAVELLPSAWHYPEITCGKITVLGKAYMTANYVDCAWQQVAEIRVFDEAVGSIVVGCLEEMPPMHEGPFSLEERQVIDTMALELGQYMGRYQAECKLRESHARLIEGQLALENKNIALGELIDHVEREKTELAFKIRSNVDRIVGPALTRLEIQLDESQKGQLAMIRSSLDNLTSPFVSHLEQGMINLTPREVEICSLIRNGYSSKDIAQTLHTSEGTVRIQRKAIRRKLGLAKSKANLATYLQQN